MKLNQPTVLDAVKTGAFTTNKEDQNRLEALVQAAYDEGYTDALKFVMSEAKAAAIETENMSEKEKKNYWKKYK